MHAEAEADQAVFDQLQDDLKRATAVNDKMIRIHGEHDAQLEYYRQLVDNLLERWQTVFAQIDLRQQELNLLGRHMNIYHGSYDWLIRWLREARERQEKIQAVTVGDVKALDNQLAEEKVIQKQSWEVSSCNKSPINIIKIFLHDDLIYFHCFVQKLLEEIERNKNNIENCQQNAKAYIDSVKVSADSTSMDYYYMDD